MTVNLSRDLQIKIRKCFTLGTPLCNRDAVAPDLEKILELEQPSNDGEPVTALSYKPTPEELKAAARAPMNGLQKALHETAAHLPTVNTIGKVEEIMEKIESHIKQLASGMLMKVPNHYTVAEALPFIKLQRKKFLGK